jgi:predicted RNase H-like HicB family nuclease
MDHRMAGGQGDGSALTPRPEGVSRWRIPMKITASQVRKFAKRYPKIIEWSDEDRCFIGSAPPLIGRCCHGATEAAVLTRLQTIVEEWIETLVVSGQPLPDAKVLAGLIETAELLANPAARKAIADARAGRGRVYSIDDL